MRFSKTACFSIVALADLESEAAPAAPAPAAPAPAPKPRQLRQENSARKPKPVAAAKASLPGGKRVRLLALHGWSQNAKGFEVYTRTLKKKLSDTVDIFYCDAPHKLDPLIDGQARLDPRSWFLYNGRDDPNNIDGFLSPAPKTYEGLEETAQAVRDLDAATGGLGFDGVIGFSQGAVLAQILVARQQHDAAQARPHPHPFRFAVCVAGFPARTEPAFSLCGKLALPSLHVIGETDDCVAPALGEELARAWVGSKVMRHEKGHIVPQRGAECAEIKAFILASMQ